MKLNWNRLSLIVVVAIIVGILSILNVIIGFAKTPHGMVYMWSGHYYLDYFYYLQFIAQGLRGYWLPHQYSATDDPSIYFHLQPYIVLGQIGRLFRLSPIAAYWISVFVLAIILVLLTFFVIREILKDKPFYLQFAALMMAISAAPFFKLISDSSGLRINLFDYWSSYGTFLKRFEPVPHHLLAHIMTLLTLLLCYKYLKNPEKIITGGLLSAIVVSLFMATILTFYPFQVVMLFFAIALTTLFYFLKALKEKKYKKAVSSTVFILTLGGLVFLTGFLVNRFYYQTLFFRSTKGVEIGWRRFVPPEIVILTFGPAIVLAFFGFKSFLKKVNPLGIMFVAFITVSFALFYSTLDLLLNTHNGRFLSPIIYILLAVLAALGIEKIVQTFSLKHKTRAFIILLLLFLLFSIGPNISAFAEKLNDKNLNSPISYLPKGIIVGFKFLNKQAQKGNVLLTPSQFLGTVVPAFTDRKTYVARHSATPNYIEKNIQTSNFYLGAMSNDEAYDFLKKNGLRFVVLTSIEGYDLKALYDYPFLKEIYKNRNITIFEVKSELTGSSKFDIVFL